jgi:hypothetical protein
MSAKNYLRIGLVLVVMGIADLRVLDMPTWLGVLNLTVGGCSILYGVSRWLKGE